jgi:hypothetical protein
VAQYGPFSCSSVEKIFKQMIRPILEFVTRAFVDRYYSVSFVGNILRLCIVHAQTYRHRVMEGLAMNASDSVPVSRLIRVAQL